jgi:hypothetical protein
MSKREEYEATLRATYLRASTSPLVLSKLYRAAAREVTRMNEVARLLDNTAAWCEVTKLAQVAERVADEAYLRSSAALAAALAA